MKTMNDRLLDFQKELKAFVNGLENQPETDLVFTAKVCLSMFENAFPEVNENERK